MNYIDQAELKLLERLMELIERAFEVIRDMKLRQDKLDLEQQLYFERKEKYEARKLKKQKKEQHESN